MTLLAALVLAPAALSNPPKLIAYWPGNGSSAEVVNATPSKSMGTVAYEDGVDGKAFDFDGRFGVVYAKDEDRFKLTEGLTLSCWVKARTLPHNGSSPQAPIIFRGDDRSGLDPYRIVLSSAGAWGFAMDNEQNRTAGLEVQAVLGEWTHLCGTWDGATGRMCFYVNGQLAATQVTDLRPLKDLDRRYHPGVSIGNVQNPFGDLHYQPFDGRICQVKIYDGALPKSDYTKPKKLGIG